MKNLFPLIFVMLVSYTNAQINRLDTSFYSTSLQETKLVDVYLPPGYEDNTDTYYSVIYYLHGWTQDQSYMYAQMLPTAQSLIEDSIVNPVIMVCADNSPDPFDGSMYVNSIIWGNYEDYMINDLVNWVESSFRVIPERNARALLGGSMGGYGVFRYGILHKEKFKVIAATAIQALNVTEIQLENARLSILQQNQPGPPFFYSYDGSGSTTKYFFLLSGAWAPNLNSSQTYIEPQIVDWPLDEQGNYIDTILSAITSNTVDNFIDQLLPEDSTGILFGCGSGDASIYPGHIIFKDVLDSLGLPFEFYDHTGGHIIPYGFKERSMIFIDSLISPPIKNFGISSPIENSFLACLEIYPNPSESTITIRFRSPVTGFRLPGIVNCQLSIFDVNGRLVDEMLVAKDEFSVDVSHLTQGIYILEARTEGGLLRGKFIKR